MTGPSEPAVLHAAVHDRIRNLLAARRLFRQSRWADWPQARHDIDTELRALLSLARQARRTAQADTVWRLGDAVDRAKWNQDRLAAPTDAELAGMAGR